MWPHFGFLLPIAEASIISFVRGQSVFADTSETLAIAPLSLSS
jgi:hypothetical protein